MLEDIKSELDAYQDLPTLQFWSKSHYPFWQIMQITSVSYSFWNKGQKVLKFWKFDEKREITPKWIMGFTSKLQGG
jgi:hypothetical protein